jgi:acyl transferase domain-containing protein
MSGVSERIARLSPEKRALLERRLREAGAERAAAAPEPVAIVGMACRFPGHVKDLDSLWQLLSEGGDAITEVPRERFDVDSVYDPTPFTPGKTVTRYGGFLDDVDLFDASFFNISPRVARRMDPQHRVVLEVVWEALENAGLPRERLAGSPTSVFMGVMGNDYWQVSSRDAKRLDGYSVAGNALSILSNHVSYQYDLRGPSLSLDTACSSSLVTTDLAVRSLRRGESDVAITGGVTMILVPDGTIAASQGGAFAPDGRCKAFDASADGYVRSEGCGVLVLKRLADARRDGDFVHALIRGCAVNQDGRSNGLTAPTSEAQAAVICAALRDAGVDPAAIDYVEAHGTGTALGDPIEIEALAEALAEGRPADRPLVVGTVKTNLGHTEAAAGVAGLIKTALALQHEEIPRHLHLTRLNPVIEPFAARLAIPREARPWPRGGRPRLAGVSSFGFGGTNAHVVLEEAPEAAGVAAEPEAGEARLLPLSAHSAAALRQRAEDVARRLDDPEGAPALRDLCFTAGLRRSHLDHRLAVTFRSGAELRERLGAFLRGEVVQGVASGARISSRPSVAFVFPGHGPPWGSMAREIWQAEPVFRDALAACDGALRPHLGESLLEVLEPGSRADPRRDVLTTQVALFSLQVALATLWRSWGVEPDAVVGHSMGEVAAAHVAGSLSLDDAARVITERSRLMQRALEQATEVGAMASVELPAAELEEALAGYEDAVSIAAYNSPTSAVLSGDSAALDELLAGFEARKVFFRRLRTPGGGHSPFVEPLRAELVERLADVAPRPAPVPIYSTVEGAPLGAQQDAVYWGRNLREPVRFSGAVDAMVEDGYEIFLELTPIPVLQAGIAESLLRHEREGLVLPRPRRGESEGESLLRSAGALYVAGSPLEWRGLVPEDGRLVALPGYPWQRERYWLDAPEAPRGAEVGVRLAGERVHPLLGAELSSPLIEKGRCWLGDVEPESFARIEHHRIRDAAVLPLGAIAEMALAAAGGALEGGPHALHDLEIHRLCALGDGERRSLQVVLRPDAADAGRFEFFGRGAARDAEGWVLHASGTIRPQGADAGAGAAAAERSALRERQAAEPARSGHYQELLQKGLQYGAAYRPVREVWHGPAGTVARIELPSVCAHESAAYGLHPVLFEACVQVAILEATGGPGAGDARRIALAAGAAQAATAGRADGPLWCLATVCPEPLAESGGPTLAGSGERRVDVSLFDDAGEAVATLQGLRIRDCSLAPSDGTDEAAGDWLVELRSRARSEDASESDVRLREDLVAAEPRRRRELLLAYLQRETGRALEMEPSKVRVDEPLDVLGVTSVMVIEMKNRVETRLEVDVPLADLVEGATLEKVAAVLLKQLAESHGDPVREGSPGSARGLQSGVSRAERRKQALRRARAPSGGERRVS